MRELRKLHLPQLVEARMREERSVKIDTSASATTAHPMQLSQSSISSDYPSPTTPTFSARGHSRFPSSTSSLASSPALRDSMDAFGVGKRPLTEVREEPQEPDEDYQMINAFANSPPDQDNDFFTQAMHANFPISEADIVPSPAHYDLTDEYTAEPDFGPHPSAKRRRADDFPLAGFTQRFGTRMPSLSRKWRQRKTANITISTQGFQERPSRANSTRAPSLANSFVEMDDQDYPLPPTPAISASGHNGGDSPVAPIDIQRANRQEEETEADVQATTPLLPPILANLSTLTKETPYQSPLQSPSIADPGLISYPQTPVETPQLGSLPSPPLSTKPSVSSMHRPRALSHTTLMPTADIPPLPMVSVPDPWADSLGHANFTIAPEPYLPQQFDVEACKQLRTDWETARRNFARHMMRISEHYGVTSRIHKLTEEKWATIDAEWKRNSDVCLSRTAENGYEQALSQSQSSVAEPAPVVTLPSLHGPKSEGKFPKLGDEDIVGPMEVVASPLQQQQQQQQRKSTKRSFFRFLQGVFTPPNVNIFGKPSGRRAATL
ncbi:MAG: hypothetical protein L6R38_008369 [Xanthoria sp. 2 TBL-2021]|nr:MAG: hypothetical protein L6R38_008369 [Xanthoria sp. 2 TBL-2021]